MKARAGAAQVAEAMSKVELKRASAVQLDSPLHALEPKLFCASEFNALAARW